MGWIPPPILHTFVSGLVGIAGLILAIQRDSVMRRLSFLSWFSEETSCLEEKFSFPGLQNLGSNCFLNVILQGLASCSHFQPFLQRILEECDSLGTGETSNILPLTDALEALLEELSIAGEQRIVLSPRRVMHEIAHYVPNFNLTSQQDAAEALLHILSSLREESSESFVPNRSPLVLSSASNGRIHSSRVRRAQTEQQRWQKHFLGPFDGISGSILTCQSCSSQISMSFEFFHTLVLSPVLRYGTTIMAGSTLVDCLKQFTVAERVNNYCCSRCWHTAAVKYLSLKSQNEEEIEKVKSCIMEDYCECRMLSSLETLPWSNDFSRTVKQTIIARSPKILCIQLQRVSANGYGDLLKLKGHISFPLVLDLSPFITSELGMKNVGEDTARGQRIQQNQQFNSDMDHPRLQIYKNILDQVPDIAQTIKKKANESELIEERVPDNEQGCSNEVKAPHMEKDHHLYHLVSVVEHFGRAGSGHYTVFRSMRHEQPEDKNIETSEDAPLHWFSISDSEVSRVSETDVLAAEASLLFYEKIVEDERTAISCISSGVNT